MKNRIKSFKAWCAANNRRYCDKETYPEFQKNVDDYQLYKSRFSGDADRSNAKVPVCFVPGYRYFLPSFVTTNEKKGGES